MSSITYCNVSNTTIRNSFGYIGGIAGISTQATSCNIDTVEIIQQGDAVQGYSGAAGGILGISVGPVNTCNVNNLTLQNYNGFTGGISGIANAPITYSTVYGNSTVKETGNVKINIGGAIGGIVGNTSSLVSYCSVTDSEIENIDGYIGGIAGISSSTLQGCDLIKSSVKATGENAYGLGGIVGHGSNIKGRDTTVVECNVNNAELIGANAVGGIAGAAVPTINTCSVDGDVGETEELQVEEESTSSESSYEITGETQGRESFLEAREILLQAQETQLSDTETTDEANIEEEKEQNTSDETQLSDTETTDEANIEEEEEQNTSNETQTKFTEENNTEEQQEEIENTVTIENNSNENLIVEYVDETVNENNYGTKIEGKQYVGGIIGRGGVLIYDDQLEVQNYVPLQIQNSNIKGTLIKGTLNAGEVVGEEPYYETGETVGNIINAIFEELTCKLIIK